MGRIDDLVGCDGFGGEILPSPVYRKDYEFCCRDCADGLSCWCSILWFHDEDYEQESPRPWAGERGQTNRRAIDGRC